MRALCSKGDDKPLGFLLLRCAGAPRREHDFSILLAVTTPFPQTLVNAKKWNVRTRAHVGWRAPRAHKHTREVAACGPFFPLLPKSWLVKIVLHLFIPSFLPNIISRVNRPERCCTPKASQLQPQPEPGFLFFLPFFFNAVWKECGGQTDQAKSNGILPTIKIPYDRGERPVSIVRALIYR